ncbi:ABC transporter permease [Spirochaetota bacterium]
MKLLLKISWRNIQRHKGKSLVIGIILFLGALIMTVGNGVITGMDTGLRENIMNRFVGHIVIVAKDQDYDNVIFTPMGKDVMVIPRIKEVKEVLDKQDYIKQYLPICRGFTLILNDDRDIGHALLLGVNFDEYQKMFNNNVILMEGKFPARGERGILVTRGTRKRLYNQIDLWIVPRGYKLKEENLTVEALENLSKLLLRDNIVVMGSSSTSTQMDIRTTVKGVIKYEYLDNYWKGFNIIDIESFREAFNYVTAHDAGTVISADKQKILKSDNLDDMFNEEVITTSVSKTSQYRLKSIMSKVKKTGTVNTDEGTYNLVFIKIKDPSKIEEYTEKLNKALLKGKTGARAITWKKAAGQLADMATMIRGALFGFVMLIFFVAIIIIMNTLSMAAMERVTEIGMMRAVGAQRLFIGRMFFIETSILTGVFGGLGIIVGTIIVIILNAMSITTDNNILQLLFGGNIFRPLITLSDILTGIIELCLVAAIATIYPIRIARRITPLDAIARD